MLWIEGATAFQKFGEDTHGCVPVYNPGCAPLLTEGPILNHPFHGC